MTSVAMGNVEGLVQSGVKAPSPDHCFDSIEKHFAGMLRSLPMLHMQSTDTRVKMDDKYQEGDMNLAPPVPYFDRRSTVYTSLLHIDENVSSGRSHSLNRAEGRHGRDLFRSTNMTRSMPNLSTSRSLHNRGVGIALSNSSECGGGKGRILLLARAEEFEQLLDGI